MQAPDSGYGLWLLAAINAAYETIERGRRPVERPI